MKSRVRISKFSLSTDILIVALKKENEQLKKEKAEYKEALEKAHRNVNGVAEMLSYFAGAKKKPDKKRKTQKDR